jgi:hypothetical protein
MLSACTESSNRSLAMIQRRIKVLVNWTPVDRW